jgi:TonB dependent receptor-like, beta-barrel
VDTTTSTMAGLVGENVIRELPLNGRDWLQLATLQVGVAAIVTPAALNHTRGLGMKMSISGGRPSENVYLVDGLVVNDTSGNSPGGAIGVNLGVDSIREFSVLTNTYSAEYGRSAGGVINAVSKSGTNLFHGSAFEFLRNSALDARNFFDADLPPFRRNQFGGSAGGPVKKDKLFFFANYEGLRQFLSLSRQDDTLSPDARNGILTSGPVTIDQRVRPYLALYPLPNGPITGDTGKFIYGAGQIGNEDYVTGKVDYLPGSKDTLAGSYTFDNSALTTPSTFNEKLTGVTARNQRVMLSLQHVFSPTVLNTVRAGFSRTSGVEDYDLRALAPVLKDPALSFLAGRPVGAFSTTGLSDVGGVGTSGGNSLWYTSFQGNDDLVWVKGRNNIRIGFSVEAIRQNLLRDDAPNGEWDFGSIQDFLLVNPEQFQADLPGSDTLRGLRTKIFGAYIQDDLRLRSNLTVNLGLRYEPSTVIREVNGRIGVVRNLSDPQVTIRDVAFTHNPTLRNFAPRIGFAWDPFGTGKTSVRSGFGIFSLVPMMNQINQKVASGPPFSQVGILTNPPASTFPTGAIQLVGVGTQRTAYIEPEPPAAYKLQWNLNVQRQITSGLSITVGYVGSRGVHLAFTSQDIDVVPPPLVTVAPDGHLLFPTTGTIQRINPNFGSIQAEFWNGYSMYHALQLNVTQQFRHGFTFQGAYNWSKNTDVGSSLNEYGGGNHPWDFDVNLDRGAADYDYPQLLTLNLQWEAPSPHSQMAAARFLLSGWQLGGIFTTQSGNPLNVLIAADRARNGSSRKNSQRPDYNAAPGCSTNAVNPGNPDNYINLECFSFPALGTLGNLGRNTLRSPGTANFDFSLFKNHNLLDEKLKVQVRAEIFNLFNHPNLGIEDTTIFDKQGKVVRTSIPLTDTRTRSRQIQFGLRLVW